MSSLIGGTVRTFHRSWKQLVLTDIVYKVIALVLLTPLVGGLFRLLVAISGSAVLSDVDILFFFLGPVGWICSISVGALWLGIVALEQASLTGIICAKTADKNLGPVGAIRFALANAWPVIRVTARIVALTLLTATPFLGLAAAVYFTLLTDYDINYYLKEKPPVLGLAVGIGVILMLALVVLLLRLFTGWFFALPLVLFEDVSPRDALKSSARRSHGHRRTLLYWIVGWFLTMAALSALATGIVAVLGRSLIPGSTDSLRLLALAVGVTVLLWAVVNLAVNLLSTSAFAAILYNLYWELGREGSADALRPDFVEQITDDSSFQMTRKQLVAGGVVAVVVAVAVGALALQSVRLEDKVTDHGASRIIQGRTGKHGGRHPQGDRRRRRLGRNRCSGNGRRRGRCISRQRLHEAGPRKSEDLGRHDARLEEYRHWKSVCAGVQGRASSHVGQGA